MAYIKQGLQGTYKDRRQIIFFLFCLAFFIKSTKIKLNLVSKSNIFNTESFSFRYCFKYLNILEQWK